MAAVILLLIGGVAWILIAPGRRFLPQFAGLLTNAAIHAGPASFFSGRSYATGTYNGREVVVRLKLRRGNHDLGHLVIAIRTAGALTLDNSGIEARTRDDEGRRALVSIVRHELLLTVEDGWLKALWRPLGFRLFPGSFSDAKWGEVLEAMHAVASSLDAAA
jgi:hypothetical protein